MTDRHIKFFDFTSHFANFLNNPDNDYSLERLNKYYLIPFSHYLNLLKNAGGLWNDKLLTSENPLSDIDYYKKIAEKNSALDLKKSILEIHKKTEKLLQRSVISDVVLFFTLGCSSDGVTLYSEGRPVIFIGVDYPDAGREYIEIIAAHEFCHAARDTTPGLLEEYGANIRMNHKDILSITPFREHFIGEGLATLFSSLIVKGKKPQDYLFYSEKAFKWCKENFKLIESIIFDESDTCGNLGRFYRKGTLSKGSAGREDYFLGFHMVSELIEQYSVTELVGMKAEDIMERYLSKKAGGN